MSGVSCGGRRQIRWVVLVILGAALLSRLLFIDLRPLHHDEGVNSWFANRIAESADFAYDPNNYHGPLFFFVVFFSFLAFGVSEFSLRLPAAMAGVAMCALPLLWWRRDRALALAAAGFLLLSPSLTYYSRYAIHESFVALFSATAVALTIATLQRRDLSLLPLGAAAVALLLTTKETAVIVLAAIGLISLVHWRRLGSALHRPGQGEAIGLALLLFAVIYVSFFSSFFRHPAGLTDSLRGLVPWVSRGFAGAGHQKPWLYYLGLIARYELPLLLWAAVGLRYAARDLTGRCLAIWAVVSLGVYSAIGYKTPWLVINVVTPLAFLGAWGWRRLPAGGLGYGGLAASAVFLAVMSLQFSWLQPWQTGNPYAYEHTSRDTAVTAVALAAAVPRARVLVWADEYWPLPFYLRQHEVEYLAPTVPLPPLNRYDFVIAPALGDAWKALPSTASRQPFLLRPGVLLLLSAMRQPLRGGVAE